LNISLSFAEYAAVNSIREVGPAAFALLSAAKLAKIGNNRTWILEGDQAGFGSLLADVNRAQRRTLSSTMSSALEGVSSAIAHMSP
jgi:hypothetical protein